MRVGGGMGEGGERGESGEERVYYLVDRVVC